ncbi:TetR family transcriptional regulator [Haloactinopolyspora alba]|uniref:TetR family transcriptional regulator n=2 Tax=Haloactinopolyspora alba TaxID=648780 RepID=A0A2P8E048_9ACTN|nr:TetR family transcriptional regulator [Haloactinopolyspora alba]
MIEAAGRVARRDGPGAVTVDAVVREAGVSRGGLMYHFPSKLDLIRALLDEDVDHLRSLLLGDDTHDAPATPADRLQVYLDECSATPGEHDYAALVAALAEDPGVSASWAELQRELDRIDTAQSEPGDVRAVVARLALDGLWLSNLVDPDRFDTDQLERILAAVWPAPAPPTTSDGGDG